MIDAQEIKLFDRESYAIDPPSKSIGSQNLPVVQRISPELARFAEIIRRHAGNDGWCSIVIQLEIFAISPNICRIMRDEKRQVADDPNAPLATINPQRIPLSKKQELEKFLLKNLIAEITARVLQCGRLTL